MGAIRSQLLIRITKVEQEIADLEVRAIRNPNDAILKGMLEENKVALEIFQDRLRSIDEDWILKKEWYVNKLQDSLPHLDPGERRKAEAEIQELKERIEKRKESHAKV